MTSSPPTFKPIYADMWQGDVDDWETVNPMECYRFKGGHAQLNKGGYWFPYQPIVKCLWDYEAITPLLVNLTKPHVLV